MHAWAQQLLAVQGCCRSTRTPLPAFTLRARVPACPAAAGLEALPSKEVRALVGAEVRARLADRVSWEHVAAFEVLQDPFRWVPAQS